MTQPLSDEMNELLRLIAKELDTVPSWLDDEIGEVDYPVIMVPLGEVTRAIHRAFDAWWGHDDEPSLLATPAEAPQSALE